MKTLQKPLLLLFLVAMLPGCSKLEDMVNATWPPVSIEGNQWVGLRAALDSTKDLSVPDIYLSLDSKEFSTQVAALIEKQVPKLSNVAIEIDKQAALISADFEISEKEHNLIFTGKVLGGASLRYDRDAIVLLPAFKSVSLTKVKHSSGLNLDSLVPVANAAIKKFLDNLNGEISKRPETRVPIKMSLSDTFDIREILKKSGISDEVEGNGIFSYRVYIKNLVSIFDKDKIQILFDVEIGEGDYTSPGVPSLPDDVSADDIAKMSDQLREVVTSRVANLLSHEENQSTVLVAVSREFIAKSVNGIFRELRLCASHDLSNKDIPFNTKIEPFKDTVVLDCAPTRDCTIHTKCEKNHDTRDCRRCADVPCPTWSNPFRFCRKCINEPTCNIAKAAQNAGYQVAFDTCRAKEAVWKLDCERIKTTDKLGCEANKEWLKRVRNIGSIGRVQGNAKLSGNGFVCLTNITFGPSLNSISVKSHVAADVKIIGDVKYTPHDLGHVLVCVPQWKDSFSARAIIPKQDINLKGTITFHENEDGLVITGKTEAHPLIATIEPPPFEAIFDANPHLYVECVAASIIKHVNVTAKAFGKDDLAPFLSGNFEEEIPSQEFEFVVKPKKATIGTKEYVGSPKMKKNVILYLLNKQG